MANAGKLYTDGGARGNPGPAGIGFLLYDDAGKLLAEHGECIGETTNNVAEYSALLAGMKKALQESISTLEVFSDSELMVRQLRGEYRVRNNGLAELYAAALQLARMFASISFHHIPRADNRLADRLVNRALDESLRCRQL